MLSDSKLYFGSCWKPGWLMPTQMIKHCLMSKFNMNVSVPFCTCHGKAMRWSLADSASWRCAGLCTFSPWPFEHEQNLISLLISPSMPSIFCLPLSFWWESCPDISIPSWPRTNGYTQQSSKKNVREPERAPPSAHYEWHHPLAKT